MLLKYMREVEIELWDGTTANLHVTDRGLMISILDTPKSRIIVKPFVDADDHRIIIRKQGAK